MQNPPRCAGSTPGHPTQRQEGVVLIIALILLLVLTLSAVTAMRSSSIDLKIVSNSLLREQAFQISETARLTAGSLVDQHTSFRNWSDFNIPSQYTFADPIPPELYSGNNVPPGDYSAEDLRYLYGNPLSANIYVSRLGADLATGAGTAIGEGYSGLGRGAATGGGYLYYDIRSIGNYIDGARAVTGADFRHVIR